MMNPLDLLVIVFMAVSAASLLDVCLMFLMKRPAIQNACFYFLGLQGMLVSWMNAKMTPPIGYEGELLLGWGLGAVAIAGLLLHVCGKGEKSRKIARILVALSVVLGMVNAFLW